MPDRDPYDKDFDFDEAENYYPVEPSERKFSFRIHWVIWLIGVNCVSLFVMLFLYSGGHPIDFVVSLFPHEFSEEELLLQDAQRIRTAVSFSKGDGVIYSIHRYTGDAMWKIYYQNDEIMNARGNTFIQLVSGYYYLSGDRKRLYKCLIDEPARVQPVLPRATARPEPMPTYIPKTEYESLDEFYQDMDGTWKNQKRQVEKAEDAKAVAAENKKRLEKLRQEKLDAEIFYWMREEQRKAEEKRRVGDISSDERFDASKAGEVKSEWEYFEDPRDQKK